MASRLAVPGHMFVRPLLQGFDRPGAAFSPAVDIPAKNAILFSERAEEIRCAFLSPIDYARHGADYCFVPGIAVSSSKPGGILRLLVKPGVRNIRTVAVDIRVTSEILLAKIILLEKFRSLQSSGRNLEFIPSVQSPTAMLEKVDAAMVVAFTPADLAIGAEAAYSIDLIEEWNDLTDLPYVYGCWVGREGELTPDDVRALSDAKTEGLRLRNRLMHDISLAQQVEEDSVRSYFDSFSYDFGEKEEQSLEEFFHYAYFHGALQDVPDIQYLDVAGDLPNEEV
jgi:chorismate dehydratase